MAFSIRERGPGQVQKSRCCKLGDRRQEEKEEKKEIMAVRKTAKGASLKRWFKEKWIDVRTGKPCGRSKGEKRGTPYCRPSKRVSSKTPKTASELTASEKRSRIAQKKKQGQPSGKAKRVKSVKRKKKKK